MRKNACDLRIVGFFMPEMDEQEYEEYLRAVFGMHEYEHENDPLLERLRDEDGEVVPGCFRVRPAPF